MPIDYIRVEGVEKVIKNLERFSDELRRQAPDVLRASLSNLKDHFEYPPSFVWTILQSRCWISI
jgi:hypothetical protein